jgi:signal transduction histidine kinase
MCSGRDAGYLAPRRDRLTSARHIVEQHGGRIAVEDAEQVGTTVSVRLALVGSS